MRRLINQCRIFVELCDKARDIIRQRQMAKRTVTIYRPKLRQTNRN